MLKRLLLSAGLVAAATVATASSFEGVATFKILGKESKGGPKEMQFSIKGDKLRTDMSHEGHGGTMIMNNKTKEMITLMPEKKAYMVMSMDPKNLPKGDKAKKAAKFSKTGKTETIAGYKAEEWVIEGAEHKTSVWGTKDLGSWSFNGGPKGPNAGVEIPSELKDGFFMLRVVGEKGGGMEATKVEKKSLSDSLFEVPSGYEKMDMGAMMGGMGGGEHKGGKPGHGMGGMTEEQKAQMAESMKSLSPEQRKMMEKMMKGKGGE